MLTYLCIYLELSELTGPSWKAFSDLACKNPEKYRFQILTKTLIFIPEDLAFAAGIFLEIYFSLGFDI